MEKPQQELLVESSVKVDMSVTTDSMADMVVSEHEDQLLEEAASLAAVAADLRKQHDEQTAQLGKLAEDVAAGFESPAAKTAAEALSAFLSESYLAFTVIDTCNAETRNLGLQVGIMTEDALRRWANKEQTFRREPEFVVSRTYTASFPESMCRIVDKLEELAAKLGENQEAHSTLTRKLADLPRVARRTKAAITKAAMLGRLNNVDDILTAIQGTTPKALPKV